MANSPLIRPYLLGGGVALGGTLGSHDCVGFISWPLEGNGSHIVALTIPWNYPPVPGLFHFYWLGGRSKPYSILFWPVCSHQPAPTKTRL